MPTVSDRGARSLWLLALCLPVLLLFWPTWIAVSRLALQDDRYLQILIAPLVCSFLILQRRTDIISQARYATRIGVPLLFLALVPIILSKNRVIVSSGFELSLGMFAIICFGIAAFVLCYGTQSFRNALYPLCCLFLMVPPPASWMDRISAMLQSGSATFSYGILRISGIPVFRHGFRFSLPGLEFEVAPECSGIRSSLALLMVAIVTGYVCLRSGWTRSALILLTVPIAIFKNAVRIVTISVLGAYVNRVFVDGPIHHKYGGLLFSTVGIALFMLVLVGLQKFERPASRTRIA